MRVPTTAETVTAKFFPFPPRLLGDKHLIWLEEAQVVVSQISLYEDSKIIAVVVASSMPKFAPLKVTLVPPVRAAL